MRVSLEHAAEKEEEEEKWSMLTKDRAEEMTEVNNTFNAKYNPSVKNEKLFECTKKFQ